MKKFFLGSFLATITVIILLSLANKIFEKPPEQLAKEQCEGVTRLKHLMNSDGVPMTIYIDGKPYKCK